MALISQDSYARVLKGKLSKPDFNAWALEAETLRNKILPIYAEALSRGEVFDTADYGSEAEQSEKSASRFFRILRLIASKYFDNFTLPKNPVSAQAETGFFHNADGVDEKEREKQSAYSVHNFPLLGSSLDFLYYFKPETAFVFP